ncbi:VCBS domain-containing protein, partial [Cobetia sp. UCD-24C]|uniref:VCBS domain-containing protein n=1 Tax=Cobetia sp. UCD-24C TaxID=1716176 RepID=UPI0006DBB213
VTGTLEDDDALAANVSDTTGTEIAGSYGTLTLNSDGSYSYVLDNSNAEVQGLDDGASLTDVFTYGITDADGDVSRTTLTITVTGSTDAAPVITGISGTDDNSVTEATGDTVTGSFTVAATAGIATVTIAGVDVDTPVDITNATEADPVVIEGSEGTLSVTGYDAGTGEVTYRYVEDGETEDHSGGDITDSFAVVVTDITDASTTDSLDIAIVDTVPTA